MKSFGRAVQGGVEKPATDETLYCVFSCTKAIMSAAKIGRAPSKSTARTCSAKH